VKLNNVTEMDISCTFSMTVQRRFLEQKLSRNIFQGYMFNLLNSWFDDTICKWMNAVLGPVCSDEAIFGPRATWANEANL
jgi:hypothetical protein